MKRLFLSLISALALLAVLTPLPLVAQSGNTKALARESMRDLQRLGLRQREALIAEMYCLLFKEGAGSPFNGHGSENVDLKRRGKVVRTVNIPYRAVERGTCFIGSNGAVYDFYETGPHARNSDPQARELWLQAKASLHLAGKQRVAPFLKKQIKDLEVRRAVHLLKQMPPVYRQALFAELYGLCYMENGANAHATMGSYELEGEHKSHKAVSRGALFLDAEGRAHDFHRTYATEYPGRAYHWECVKFCFFHGHHEMFIPFKEELTAMQKHHAARPASEVVPSLPSVVRPEPPAPAGQKAPAASPLGTPLGTPLGSPALPRS